MDHRHCRVCGAVMDRDNSDDGTTAVCVRCAVSFCPMCGTYVAGTGAYNSRAHSAGHRMNDALLLHALRTNSAVGWWLGPRQATLSIPRHASWSLKLTLWHLQIWTWLATWQLGDTPTHPCTGDDGGALGRCRRLVRCLWAEYRAIITARCRCVFALLYRCDALPEDILRAVLMDWVDVLFCHPWQRTP